MKIINGYIFENFVIKKSRFIFNIHFKCLYQSQLTQVSKDKNILELCGGCEYNSYFVYRL